MTLTIVLASFYIFFMPISLWIISLAHKKIRIDKKREKAQKKKQKNFNEDNLPKPLMGRIRRNLKFARKDTRAFTIKKPKGGEPPKSPITNRMFYLALWIIGLLIVVISSFIGSYVATAIGFFIFYLNVIIAYIRSSKIIKIRDKKIAKMVEIANSKLGQPSKEPSEVVNVLEWRDHIKPDKVEFYIPTSFSNSGEEGFLRHFNQFFGSQTAWVADDTDEEPGWDYDEGRVKLRSVPPLPKLAPWDEHYILNEAIAWSFFPIALGVENGVELKNPKNGEVEHVLGFDVSGEQAKVGKKAGVAVSGRITKSPMVFVGGGTGGGKALSVDTPILRLTLKED